MNIEIKINENFILVDSRLSILQACELANFDVPRFCYHERLSVAGNCRMCLVEIEKAPKLVASCAMPLVKGMHILTNSSLVKKAREGILEFLLINHPLDCPICDQGGECDLQDQVLVYGSDRGRFREYKRAVEDKNCGPLIKMIMTRCIHCTRCIRFANEIAGVPGLGTSGRGQTIEVGTYIERLFISELSANVIDLCPVGALTSKPYMFSARSWELETVESIDTSDAVGTNIRIDLRGYEIRRILPNLNEQINEEWISDKTRFAFDGLKRQRLSRPFLKFDKLLKNISWLEAFECLLVELNKTKKNLTGSVGTESDLESTFFLKIILSNFGKNQFYNSSIFGPNNLDFSSYYTFNSTIISLKTADSCFLIGVNPRKEGAIINFHLRKRFIRGNFNVNVIGSSLDLSFPTIQIGVNSYDFLKIVEGKHSFCKNFRKAKNPIFIFGSCFFEALGETEVLQLLKVMMNNSNLLRKNWLGLNYFSTNASEMNSKEVGLSTSRNSNLLNSRFIYSVGDADLKIFSKNVFSIYQGHHGNSNAMHANLILPGSAFTEKTSTFINMEGKRQFTQMALLSPGDSREDKKILEAVINLKTPSAYLSQNFISFYKKKSKNFQYCFYKAAFANDFNINVKNRFLISGKFDNFYLTNVISKASPTMVRCSKQLLEKRPFR